MYKCFHNKICMYKCSKDFSFLYIVLALLPFTYVRLLIVFKLKYIAAMFDLYVNTTSSLKYSKRQERILAFTEIKHNGHKLKSTLVNYIYFVCKHNNMVAIKQEII